MTKVGNFPSHLFLNESIESPSLAISNINSVDINFDGIQLRIIFLSFSFIILDSNILEFIFFGN